ncbi:MAG: oligosaccharide repeat unit polymerase [Methanothrix sp.]|nr:oligosaccharide repeat unit polymerase [Methanothrix sp.]
MPYLALGILTGTALLVAVSYLRFRDALYPTVIHAGIWGTVLFLYCLTTESFLPLSGQTLFIFLSGMVAFAAGCYLVTWNLSVEEAPELRARAAKSHWLLSAIFWINIAGLPVSILSAVRAVSGGPTESFLINLRLLETSAAGDRYIWNYLVLLSLLSCGLHLLAIDERRKHSGRMRFAVSIAVALVYSLLNTGRTWFVHLLIFLVALAVATRRIPARRALLYVFGIGILIFSTIALLLNKGGSLESGLAQNVHSVGTAFQTYLLGPLPSFDIFMRHQGSLQWGSNVFRSLWLLTDKLGFETPAPPLVHQFVNVPYPSNVYTLYRPYFEDFGFLGAIVMPFFLGIFHGWLYGKMKEGDPFFLCMYALSLNSLALQFFQELYFATISQWLQTAAILLIYFFFAERNSPSAKLSMLPLKAPTADAT